MNREEVPAIYTDVYARSYDDKFLTTKLRRSHTDFEEEILRSLMPMTGRWLDVACGTGYFLRRFPSVQRTGLDLSPAMLDLAKDRNPDAQFVLGDFLEPRPEWSGCYDLVSCLGSAYVVVETLNQIRTLIANLARWTSEQGSCFLPMNPCDGLNGARIPYETTSPYPGRIIITGITWTYVEDTGEIHRDLIAPQEQFLIAEFERYFERVESVAYPRVKPDWEQIQRGLIAGNKRSIPL